MKIKICGLKRKEDVDYVNQYKPDYAGFVFAGKKRRINYDTAKKLRERLSDDILSVGIFVNEDIDEVIRLVDTSVIQLIQLHGDENEDYILRLKNRLLEIGKNDVPLIKAIRVVSREQVLEADKLPVDYLLLDAFSENEYGGSGKCFNHELIPNIQKPYMIAGGIDCNNVTKITKNLMAKNVTMPFCIDVSSSVETDGVKDGDKIKEMILAVKSIDV